MEATLVPYKHERRTRRLASSLYPETLPGEQVLEDRPDGRMWLQDHGPGPFGGRRFFEAPDRALRWQVSLPLPIH